VGGYERVRRAAEDPGWYGAKFAELGEQLRAELAERYRSEMEALEGRLDPVPQWANINRLVDGFVGREWLVKDLEDWQLGRVDKRLFWLTGLPGTGKSAF
jgi:hypothetical protein